VAGLFQVALYRGLVVAQSAAAGFTVVIAGVTAALSSIRCAKSRSAAKCCFAIASACAFPCGRSACRQLPRHQAGRAMDGDRFDQLAGAVIDVGDNRAHVAQFAAK
jgi:hypothetical protein